MKLFVWEDPYRMRYGNSLLFVVAKTVEQAKALASVEKSYVILHEPTRVLDIPCAEWHEWSK